MADSPERQLAALPPETASLLSKTDATLSATSLGHRLDAAGIELTGAEMARDGDDLVISLQNGSRLVIDGAFAEGAVVLPPHLGDDGELPIGSLIAQIRQLREGTLEPAAGLPESPAAAPPAAGPTSSGGRVFARVEDVDGPGGLQRSALLEDTDQPGAQSDGTTGLVTTGGAAAASFTAGPALAGIAADTPPLVSGPVVLAMAEDGTLTITRDDLLSMVSDADTPPAALRIDGVSADSGSLTENPDGSWSFAAPAHFAGTVAMSYTVSDGASTALATATVEIAPEPDAPTGVAIDARTLAGGETFAPGEVGEVSVTASFADRDGSEAHDVFVEVPQGFVVAWLSAPAVPPGDRWQPGPDGTGGRLELSGLGGNPDQVDWTFGVQAAAALDQDATATFRVVATASEGGLEATVTREDEVSVAVPAPAPEPEPVPTVPLPAEGIVFTLNDQPTSQPDFDAPGVNYRVDPPGGRGRIALDGAATGVPGLTDGDVSVAYRGDHSAVVELESAWNTIKSVRAESDAAGRVTVRNFVHAEVSLGDGGKSRVSIEDAKRGSIATGDGNDRVTIAASTNGAGWDNSFAVATGAGNDRIGLTGDKGYTVFDVDAGAGNDVVWIGGTYREVAVDTGAGNDRVQLDGRYGDATITTGDGRDQVRLTGDNADAAFRIDTGAGNDVVRIGGTYREATVDTGAGNDRVQLDGHYGDATVTTGDGRDQVRLTGDNADSAFRVDTGAGNDVVRIGGTYREATVDTGAGNDRVQLDGRYGEATVTTGDGRDQVRLTGDNADAAFGIDAGAGNDRVQLDGHYGEATITTGDGRDQVRIGGDYRKATVDGGMGDDRLFGGDNADILIGGAGRDVLRGYGGDDRLFMDGDDRRVDGGAGDDTLVLDFAAGTVDGSALARRANDVEGIDLDAREGLDLVLELAADDVAALGDAAGDFFVSGSAGDRVVLGGAWAVQGSVNVGGQGFTAFASSDPDFGGTLYVDNDVAVEFGAVA